MTQADPKEAERPKQTVENSLLIIKSNANSLVAAENFLRNRNWLVYSAWDLKQGLAFLIQHQPKYIMISVDHPNKKVRMLPKLLAQAFPVLVIAFAETQSASSSSALQQMSNYSLFPPVSGPAVERIVLKIKKDLEIQAQSQQHGLAHADGSAATNSDQVISIKGGSAGADQATGNSLSGDSISKARDALSKFINSDSTDSEVGQAGFMGTNSMGGSGDLANTSGQSGMNGSTGGPAYMPNQSGGGMGAGASPHMNSTQNNNVGSDSVYPPGGNGITANGSNYTGSGASPTSNSGSITREGVSTKSYEYFNQNSPENSKTGGSITQQGPNNQSYNETQQGPNNQSYNATQQGPNNQSYNETQQGPNNQSYNETQQGPSNQSYNETQQGPNNQSRSATQQGTGAGGSGSYYDPDEPSEHTGKFLKKQRQPIEYGKEKQKRQVRYTSSEYANEAPLTKAEQEKLNAGETKNTLISEATAEALKQSANIDENSKEIIAVQNTANVACIVIESPRFAGYLIAAFGQNQGVDEKFLEVVKNRLFQFLKDRGEDVVQENGMNIKIKEVEFEGWAIEYADFLRKSVHEGQEMAMAFFPREDIKASVSESASEQMAAVSVKDLKADVPLEFDLYVYLPNNNKYILYTPKGRTFMSKQKQKLVEKGVDKMHIRRESEQDLKKYRAQNYLNEKIEAFKTKKKEAEESVNKNKSVAKEHNADIKAG